MNAIQFVTISLELLRELLCLSKAFPPAIVRREHGPADMLFKELRRTTNTPGIVTTFLRQLGCDTPHDYKVRWVASNKVEIVTQEITVSIYADPHSERWAVEIRQWQDQNILRQAVLLLRDRTQGMVLQVKIDGKPYVMAAQCAMKYISGM